MSLPDGAEAGAPFFADVAGAPAGAEAVWLTAADGTRLRAVAWRHEAARGTAVVFPGRTEFAEKYGRVVQALVERGLAVVVLDWRGQGLSDRHPRNPMLGHVQDFRDYQQDVTALLDFATALDLPGPRYLVAHSMGGCIGLRTLLERAEFCGAILSAPMWRLQMRAATRELTSKMTQLANLTGFGARLMPGTRPGPTAHAGFQDNALTSDAATFGWCARQIEAHPELSLGGPSMQWTYAAIEEMTRLYIAPLPRLPMLVMLGDAESVVSSTAIRTRVAQMASGELLDLPGARHEIFMEGPETLARVWQRIDRFLAEVPTRREPSAPARPA
ncbi:MAG: alpha/beta hydrolase [Amaricoccus sp.]|uniref:alpha/beta fold hydrolase n=1 Tax=Amaricoccus sp. TaxID=1872485 RepID=UPI0039E6DE6A